MASEQPFSTNDLRSGAKEFNRDKNSRVKWAHGQSFGPGRRIEDNRPRPARIYPSPKDNSGFHKARAAIRSDIHYASGESSADEELDEPSLLPAPDAEVTYSYDAAKGPSHGSQVLGLALDKAIERYEVRQTDKLIKEEYEVLDAHGEPFSPGPKLRKGTAAEDEDYEFIEA